MSGIYRPGNLFTLRFEKSRAEGGALRSSREALRWKVLRETLPDGVEMVIFSVSGDSG